jgi:SAM-dependent methyltransferase
MKHETAARMRDDWNRRAREDAHYYVAFGRREQPGEEFFDTGREQVLGLMRELKRFPGRKPDTLRALEIGCGPGRLMRPLAGVFAEVHGVDISDEMVARAESNLSGAPNAHAWHAPDSDLRRFEDGSFDFVYSYAVFQHIPSREVVMGYLDEAERVLRPGGVIRVQLNGLPETAKTYDTWSGVRIAAGEIRAWSKAKRLCLLALEGTETQYMWATFQKPSGGGFVSQTPRIRRVTNAHSSEPASPVSGRFAALALWVDHLPTEPSLNDLEVRIGGKPAALTYLGPAEPDGMRQLNLLLPEGLRTGLAPVELAVAGAGDAARFVTRLIQPGPSIPKVISLTDGMDLMTSTRISSGIVKLTIEEVQDPAGLVIEVNGKPAPSPETFRTDPRLPRWEVNFRVPTGTPPGPAEVSIRLGRRNLGRFAVEIV